MQMQLQNILVFAHRYSERGRIASAQIQGDELIKDKPDNLTAANLDLSVFRRMLNERKVIRSDDEMLLYQNNTILSSTYDEKDFNKFIGDGYKRGFQEFHFYVLCAEKEGELARKYQT